MWCFAEPAPGKLIPVPVLLVLLQAGTLDEADPSSGYGAFRVSLLSIKNHRQPTNFVTSYFCSIFHHYAPVGLTVVAGVIPINTNTQRI